MSKPRLLFLCASPTAFADLFGFLRASGFQFTAIPVDETENAVFGYLASVNPQLVVVEDATTRSHTGLQTAQEVRRLRPELPVIFATPQGSEQLAVAIFRAGLQDYVKLPIAPADFLERINSNLAAGARWPSKVAVETKKPDSTPMIGMSGSLLETKEYLERAAQTGCTVLVTGETGTGKELAARYVHEKSPRRERPFVCINCAAIPDSLLESELFGHSRGAFTDARETHDGLLRAADGGTVFLDEIGDMSPFAQAKILRVLDTKEVCRLGETRHVHLNLRFVAATNQDLVAMTTQKTFRRDLLFRLDVAHVHLPPLRERKDDISLLVQEFCREFAPVPARDMPEFTVEFFRALLDYDWPGNIRELKNLIEGLFLKQLPPAVGVEHLPMHLRRCLEKHDIPDDEKGRLLSVLLSTKWNKTKAAERLNWSRMTLYRKIEKYHIVNQPTIILDSENSPAPSAVTPKRHL